MPGTSCFVSKGPSEHLADSEGVSMLRIMWLNHRQGGRVAPVVFTLMLIQDWHTLSVHPQSSTRLGSSLRGRHLAQAVECRILIGVAVSRRVH